jgi:ankyrin repeat protein
MRRTYRTFQVEHNFHVNNLITRVPSTTPRGVDAQQAMADHADDGGDNTLHSALFERRDLEAIRSIVERDPQSVRRRSWTLGIGNLLPIHAAIELGSPPPVTRFLLEKWPDSVREGAHEASTFLPAHMVCQKPFRAGSSDMETARRVVEAWPEALQVRDENGYLPLHLAHDFDLIRYLIETWPESIQEADGEGITVLHRAVAIGAELAHVRFLVERCLELVQSRDTHGRISLHCISARTKLDVVQYLVSLRRQSLSELDSDGYVPLHSAVSHDYAHNQIVAFLVDRAPNSVRVRAKDGSLPLHLASQHIQDDDDFDAIRRVVAAWPQALGESTDKGLLPLHYAAECPNFPLVRFLVGLRPESVQEKSGEGWLAVHLVLNCSLRHLTDADEVRPMYGVARFLMDRFPQSAQEPTNEGFLPLHVAASRGYDFAEDEDVQMELEFFQDFVRRAPAAVRVASNAHHFPFHYAIWQSGLSMAAARFLAEQWPDVVRFSDEEGRTALHMAVSRNLPRLDFVEFLVEQRPQLPGATDSTGSTPLHVAAAQIQSESDVLLGSSGVGSEREMVQRRIRELLDIVRYLAEHRPQSLSEADHLGSLPVHIAAARVFSALDLVRLLAELRPEANAGSSPLHVAVARGRQCSLQLVQSLVEPYPGSVRTRNGDGMSPLFLAATSDAALDVLFFLATTWPEAISGTRPRRPSQPPPSSSKRRKRS